MPSSPEPYPGQTPPDCKGNKNENYENITKHKKQCKFECFDLFFLVYMIVFRNVFVVFIFCNYVHIFR